MTGSEPATNSSAPVDVVIVTFRSPEGLLERTVSSVLDAGGPLGTVRVIDTGGRARDRLAAVARGGVTVVADVEIVDVANDGFGAAANVGIRRALGAGRDALVVLNDDVAVSDGWLDALVEQLADAVVGAVQPLLVSDDGTRVNSAGVDLDRYGAGSDRLRDVAVSSVEPAACDLAVFTGGAVLLRAAMLRQVGGFDERFFLYYEDVELAERARRCGWRFRLAPSVHVRHAGSATTSTMGVEVVRLRERNRLWRLAMGGSAGDIGRGVWLAVRRVRHHPRSAHLSALVTGVGGMVPRLLERWRGVVRAASVGR